MLPNLQKTGRRTLVLWYGFIQTILKAEVNVGMRNIDMHNSPSDWDDITDNALTYPPYWNAPLIFLVLGFMSSFYSFIEGHFAFQYDK